MSDSGAFDPSALALLATLSDAGSLSAAARAAGVTQPALTKQLARLERQLGVPLFVRSIRGVAPTEYGQALLPRARIVRAQLAQAAETLQQLRGLREGQVCVAMSHLATVRLVPGVLPLFRARWPGVRLRLVAPTFAQLMTGLREGLPDMAVVQLPGEDPGPEFVVRPLLETTLAAVVRPGHPLARVTTLSALAEAKVEWVLPSEDSATGRSLREAFRRARLPAPRCTVTCETLTGVEAIVRATDLVAAMPAEVHDARCAASGLLRLPLAPAPRGRTLALVRWADNLLTPAAADLAELFVAQAHANARSQRRHAAG
jgi:LysR family transcriptional regulator, regulator of abg operon